MQWLFPIFLAATAAIGLPVALHLFRRWPRQPVLFPALRFLAPAAFLTNNKRQRLLRWLVLALRCSLFALLAATFARPYRSAAPPHTHRATIVVVDNSLSLHANGRWAALQAWAEDRIGRLEIGDKLGIALAAPQPSWATSPTSDIESALANFRNLAPGWALTHLEPTLRMAGEALAAIPADRREIIVLTDHQRLSWIGTDFNRPLPPGVVVIFPEPPKPLGRQAALLAPQINGSAEGTRAAVSIRNFTGAHARVLRVYHEREAAPIHEETLQLGDRELRTLSVKLPVSLDDAAWFKFELDADDLPADDAAWAVWQPAKGGTVILDPMPNHVPSAVSKTPMVDCVAAALSATKELQPGFKTMAPPAGEWPARSVAVLRNDESFNGEAANRLDAFLGAGGAAIVFVDEGPRARSWLASHKIELVPLAPQADPWRVHDWRLDHPLVVALGRHRLGVLLDWEFRSGSAMSVNAVEALAHWSDEGIAVGEFHVGSGRVLTCGFAPDRQAGNWPATPAFVQFLHQAAAYLASAQDAAVTSGQVGQPLVLGNRDGQWRAKAGPQTEPAAVETRHSVVPLAPGLFEFAQGSDHTYFAINVPPEESDPAVWDAGAPWSKLVSKDSAQTTDLEPRARAIPSQNAAFEAEQRSPLWWWAVAAAGLLMLAELLLANRTTR